LNERIMGMIPEAKSKKQEKESCPVPYEFS
jgi:hypothetical protein